MSAVMSRKVLFVACPERGMTTANDQRRVCRFTVNFRVSMDEWSRGMERVVDGEKLVASLGGIPVMPSARIHDAHSRVLVDDGESPAPLPPSLSLSRLTRRLNFPGRPNHLECTGSTKVNRRLLAENKATRLDQTSYENRTSKQSRDCNFRCEPRPDFPKNGWR